MRDEDGDGVVCEKRQGNGWRFRLQAGDEGDTHHATGGKTGDLLALWYFEQGFGAHAIRTLVDADRAWGLGKAAR